MNLLIADDHPIVRFGLKQILAAEPDMVVVGEAANGAELLDLVRTVDWDVIVLDYKMPDRNGLDLIREIKHQQPDRPILILSMVAEEMHAARVYKAGGAGFVKKECSSSELTIALRKVMNGGKYISSTFAEKLAVELGLGSNGTDGPRHDLLTDREYRVMWLLASGKRIKDIARELYLSPSTISTYRARVLKKLSLSNNAMLVRYANDQQLL